MSKLFQFILKKFRIPEIIENQHTIIITQTEILKAQIFNSSIEGCEWLVNKSFSPGVWAADYGLLYTLFRVVTEMKPNNILEFGLGQSSKIIHQYANFFKVKATTCEHDSEWISFFNEGKCGEYPIDITQVELEEIEYKGEKTLSIKNIDKLFEGNQFDLIVVDAPFGSDHYSRSQIITLAEHNLSKRFCIIIDDYERVGEQETVNDVLKLLEDNDVKYCCKQYYSSKSHFLICSQELKFLTSL